MFHKTQNKIIIIMSLIALMMMAGLYILKKSDQEKIALLLSNQRNEKEVLLEKIIELKSSSVENFAYDYTYWDEMVDFVNSGDQVWAKENIEVSMPTFGVDIAWVYRTDLSVLYSTNRIGADPMDQLPLSTDILEKIVSRGSFCHFFILTDPGLIEIFGASIHPTFDEERKTPPQGYFFVGCLWSETYLEEMSELSGTEISLVPPEEEQLDSNTEDLKNFTVTNTKALYGWDGTHIIDVHAKSESLIAKTLNDQSNVQYRISTAYSILVLVFLSLILFLLINRPLNLLSRSLADGNPDLIKGLTSQKNEFGNLAVMISEFLNQKNQLVNDITERKRAEKELRASEERMRDIIFSVGDWVWEVDENGKYTYSSKKGQDFLGYAPEGIIGKTPFDFMPLDEAERMRPVFSEIVSKKAPIKDLVNWNIRKDGKRICLFTNGVPVLDENGNLTGYRGVDKDITERKQAEEALKESEERFRNIYENMTIGMYRTTSDGQIVMCNPALIQMLGYTSFEELAQRNLEKEGYEPKYDRKAFRERIESDGQIHGLESAWRKKNGSFIYVSESARVIRDESGKVLYYEGTVEDITARKKAEDQLLIKDFAVESSVSAIALTDIQGKIIYANNAYVKMWGYNSANEVLGKHIYEFAESKEIVDDAILALQSGKGFVSEETARKNDGTIFDIQISANIVKSHDGTPICMMASFIDITERKRAEKALRESEKNYRELINGMNETVWIIDFKGNLIDVNKTAIEVFGYSKEELLTIGLFGIDTSLKKKDIKTLAKTMQADQLQIFETTHTTKDGRTFPVEVYSSLASYQGKKVILSIARDITDRKRVEEALRKSEVQLANAANLARMGPWEYDVAQDLFTFNDQFYTIFRTTAEEAGGYTMSSSEYAKRFVHPDDLEVVGVETRKAIETTDPNYTSDLEHRMIYADGEAGYINVRIFVVKDNHGRTIKTYGVNQDITVRKQAEEAIRQSEIQFKTLFMSMSDGFYLSEVIYDDNGNPCDYRYLEVNPKFEQILGLRRDQIIGKRYKELVPTDTTQWLDNYCKVARTGTPLTYEFYSAEYHMYFETYSYQPVKGQVSVFVRDITDRKRADEALHSANERLKILNQMTEIVHETLEPDIIFKRITDAFVKSMGFSTALVLTKDENGDIFCVRSLSSSKLLLTRINKILGFPLKKLTFPVSGIIEGARKAAATSDIIIVNRLSDIAHPPLSKPVCNALQKLGGSKSYILIPLVLDGKLIGGMLVSSMLEQVPQTDIDMLGAFASTAVQAITNAELLARSNKAKDQIQKNLKEKEILLRELYHRTKNNMQVISAMLRLRARFIPDKQLQFAFSEIETKIRTMALVHKRLYESNDLSSLNLKVYFQDLITLIRQSYLTGEDQIRIPYKAEDAPALIDTAIPLGLVVNELITNAIKHAFPQGRRGEIRVSLGVGKKGELKLEVSDNGVGLPEGFDMKKDGRLGLGTILDLIKYQLDGEVTFESKNGVTCRIVIKKELYKPRV